MVKDENKAEEDCSNTSSFSPLNNNFYKNNFGIYAQSPDSEISLKSIDANCLIEVFDMLNDTIAVLISISATEAFVKDLLNLASQIQDAVEKNLDENEFEGVDMNEHKQIKLTLSTALNANVACYYQRYLRDANNA